MMDERAVHRATAVMTAGTALSRLTGLLRVVAMAYALGVTGTRLADTYAIANTAPNIIYELFLGGILTSVLVPVLVRAREDPASDPSPLVTVSVGGLVLLSLAAAIAAPVVMHLYTLRIADPAEREDVRRLATALLRWFSPQILFYGLSAIAQALLNTRRRFAVPMFAPILNNLVVCGTFVAFASLYGRSGVDLSAVATILLGAGTTAGVVVQAAVLVPMLRADRLRFRPDLRDASVRRVVRLSGYVVGYVLVNQIGLLVVYWLALRRQGGVAAYQTAFIFFQLPHGLFAVSLLTALHPGLSTAAARDDLDGFRARFADGVRGIFYLVLPAVAGYIVLAPPITRLLLSHGAAGTSDADAVAGVLRVFALGLVFFSVFQLLYRCFTALADTRTLFVANVFATAVWIAVNVPLSARYGARGLAAGHAISYVAGSAALLWALRRRIGTLGVRSFAPGLARIVAVAAAMGAGVWLVAGALVASDLLTVTVSVVSGAILYLAFSQVTRIPERRMLLAVVRRGR